MSYKHKGWPNTAGLSEIESEEIKIWLQFKAKPSVLQSFPNFQNVGMQGSGFFVLFFFLSQQWYVPYVSLKPCCVCTQLLYM